MKRYQMWSGGKDSTASIILEHIHKLPKSTIVFSEVMFDKTRGISGEFPEHINFIYNVAIPVFKEWGYEVICVKSDKDYLDCFFHKCTKGKNVGKICGFPLARSCIINSRCKVKPLMPFNKHLCYVGIAADEINRLERLENTTRFSLLERFGVTEFGAFQLCKKYGLLSPIYNFSRRGGCWFCPNMTINQFRWIYENHFELWTELLNLSKTENMISQYFSYDKTFDDVARLVKGGDKNVKTD